MDIYRRGSKIDLHGGAILVEILANWNPQGNVLYQPAENKHSRIHQSTVGGYINPCPPWIHAIHTPQIYICTLISQDSSLLYLVAAAREQFVVHIICNHGGGTKKLVTIDFRGAKVYKEWRLCDYNAIIAGNSLTSHITSVMKCGRKRGEKIIHKIISFRLDGWKGLKKLALNGLQTILRAPIKYTISTKPRSSGNYNIIYLNILYTR